MTALQQTLTNDGEAYEEEGYEDSEEDVRHADKTGILRLFPVSERGIPELPAEDGIGLR
ncbi:hypothetical protein QUF72_14745 [Desulfobacterales bacterium HSG2]|nr:hypothetical protein [Desulfobacterales bacterium HSG2]